MKAFDTVTEAINNLQLRGYTYDFKVNKDCLFCDEKRIQLKPEEFEIDEVYRFEGNSDPGDENIVYAISSQHHHLKGILVSAFGTYSEITSDELLSKLQYKP